ncbi:hypothetical protein OS493_012285 [Desmophyllum pertusum]|uniref:Uncharacterized protein n=1 Tax=Desmophyllum pertusum TaxID=174260 RepID=A0A9W9ZQI2_9CNID|nr:hypothetical protein OS493_012285 [Desmophyllum pertusum]
MFVYRNKPTKHPTTLAAMMTSVTKEREDYEYLAGSLFRKGIKSLTYGTDGELALEQAFENVYPIGHGPDRGTTRNIHLRCFTHVESDIKARLQHLKKDGRRMKGLVDCEREESFESSLVLMQLSWPPEFSQWMSSNKGRIRPLTETLKLCMRKPTRVAAGLGNPPNKWHNQGTEALHQVMKEEAKGDAVDQATIHENVNTRVVVQQKNEFIKALYGMGEYRLSPEYANVSVDPVRWSQMKQEQRAAYVKKVLGGGLIEDDPSEDLGLKSFPSPQLKVARFSLVEINNAKLTTPAVPSGDERGLIFPEQRLVIEPTVVTKRTKITCSGCATSAATGGICQHSVAVAETRGTLREHIEDYKKQNDLESKLAFRNVPRGAGAKKRQKKPRRGQNNIQQQPLVAEIDPNAVVDSDFDCPKPSRFTEYYHNDEPFRVVFVNDFKNATACEQCKVNFARILPIAPWDICIMHEERYMYPIKDPQNHSKVLRYTPTRKKVTKRFYCASKDCLLPRHPYFWKGN